MAKAKAWTTVEGVTTEYKIKDEIWIKKNAKNVITTMINNSQKIGVGRPPSLKTWMEKNCVKGETFDLSEYYKKIPNGSKEQYRKANEKCISDMIKDRKLTQLSHNRFKIIRELVDNDE